MVLFCINNWKCQGETCSMKVSDQLRIFKFSLSGIQKSTLTGSECINLIFKIRNEIQDKKVQIKNMVSLHLWMSLECGKASKVSATKIHRYKLCIGFRDTVLQFNVYKQSLFVNKRLKRLALTLVSVCSGMIKPFTHFPFPVENRKTLQNS